MGEEAGVRDHAVVGADRLALDVPGALQHLERLDHPERRVRRAPRAAARPGRIVGQVREQDPARPQRLERVLHDAPRLGQVEHDPVEVVLVDALVDVAHLDRRAGRLAEEPVHVRDRARRAKSSRIS